MHRHLDEELGTLRALLLEMANVVDEQLANAITAAVRCDETLASQVRARDDEVDALELRVDRECERLLALYTPVAADLRLVLTAVKVNTDLERVGDQAKNIAKHVLRINKCGGLITELPIRDMGDLARSILNDALDAFISHDRVLARQVLVRDREIDQLYTRIFDEIVNEMRKKPDLAEEHAHLTGMIKAIERVADHAKNIGESVVFLIEGIDIRHAKSRQLAD